MLSSIIAGTQPAFSLRKPQIDDQITPIWSPYLNELVMMCDDPSTPDWRASALRILINYFKNRRYQINLITLKAQSLEPFFSSLLFQTRYVIRSILAVARQTDITVAELHDSADPLIQKLTRVRDGADVPALEILADRLKSTKVPLSTLPSCLGVEESEVPELMRYQQPASHHHHHSNASSSSILNQNQGMNQTFDLRSIGVMETPAAVSPFASAGLFSILSESEFVSIHSRVVSRRADLLKSFEKLNAVVAEVLSACSEENDRLEKTVWEMSEKLDGLEAQVRTACLQGSQMLVADSEMLDETWKDFAEEMKTVGSQEECEQLTSRFEDWLSSRELLSLEAGASSRACTLEIALLKKDEALDILCAAGERLWLSASLMSGRAVERSAGLSGKVGRALTKVEVNKEKFGVYRTELGELKLHVIAPDVWSKSLIECHRRNKWHQHMDSVIAQMKSQLEKLVDEESNKRQLFAKRFADIMHPNVLPALLTAPFPDASSIKIQFTHPYPPPPLISPAHLPPSAKYAPRLAASLSSSHVASPPRASSLSGFSAVAFSVDQSNTLAMPDAPSFAFDLVFQPCSSTHSINSNCLNDSLSIHLPQANFSGAREEVDGRCLSEEGGRSPVDCDSGRKHDHAVLARGGKRCAPSRLVVSRGAAAVSEPPSAHSPLAIGAPPLTASPGNHAADSGIFGDANCHHAGLAAMSQSESTKHGGRISSPSPRGAQNRRRRQTITSSLHHHSNALHHTVASEQPKCLTPIVVEQLDAGPVNLSQATALHSSNPHVDNNTKNEHNHNNNISGNSYSASGRTNQSFRQNGSASVRTSLNAGVVSPNLAIANPRVSSSGDAAGDGRISLLTRSVSALTGYVPIFQPQPQQAIHNNSNMGGSRASYGSSLSNDTSSSWNLSSPHQQQFQQPHNFIMSQQLPINNNFNNISNINMNNIHPNNNNNNYNNNSVSNPTVNGGSIKRRPITNLHLTSPMSGSSINNNNTKAVIPHQHMLSMEEFVSDVETESRRSKSQSDIHKSPMYMTSAASMSDSHFNTNNKHIATKEDLQDG